MIPLFLVAVIFHGEIKVLEVPDFGEVVQGEDPFGADQQPLEVLEVFRPGNLK
jgi:hypothetical protein